jgi:baseplate J-like protein
MATGIIYLDVDDEITSAASRVRQTESRRVALVLPYGSRVATSRINFRLLSRDALINEKQLAVVAGDSATRALAASAGLPVFSSVAEYEAEYDVSSSAADEPPPAPSPGPIKPEVVEEPPRPARRGKKAVPPTPAEPTIKSPVGPSAAAAPVTSAAAAPVSPAAPVAPARHATDEARADRPADIEPRLRPLTDGPRTEPRRPAESTGRYRESRPGSRPGARRSSRLPIVIVLAALALVVLVGGVGAYVLLPSATVVVTPQVEDLAPLDITVVADPNATAPNAASLVVPAAVVSLDVSTGDTFPATDKRIEEAGAKGTVRFSNLDFLRTNTIPGGSIVSTNAGVRFRTNATITVPRADLVGLTVFPGRRNVGVTAVEPGTAGNVEPNTIVIVPKGEDPQALKVVNPDAASGGTHEEFPKVAQEDVDKAMEQLTAALAAVFQARIADPSIAAPGATVFDTTARLGEATPTIDPATLVGKEVESFELELSATGTVVTVNPAPVAAIAEQLLRAKLDPGHQLVANSIAVQVGEPVVSGQSVSFSATATGQEVAILDANELRALILGKPLASARELLAAYGRVELTAWPDWVGSIPTIADRVVVRIDQDIPVESPAPSGSAS